MPCAAFEDLLLDYGQLSRAERERVDAHVAGCPDCRDYLSVLDQLDRGLAMLYSGAHASAEFRARALRRAGLEAQRRKAAFVPELLDFIGWAAVLATIAGLLLPLAGALAPRFSVLVALGAVAGIAVPAAAWTVVRSFAEAE